jgi:hypothetical protein
MSALPRFEVRLMVGRTLYRSLEARDQQAAEDIALFLYREQRDRSFLDEGEEIMGCDINLCGEATS